MIGDTITVTINAVPKVLVKITEGNYSSEYRLNETLSQFVLKIKHTKDRVSAGSAERHRHSVILTETVLATATDPAFDRVSSIVFVSKFSDVAANVAYNQVGLQAWANQANVVKLVGWES